MYGRYDHPMLGCMSGQYNQMGDFWSDLRDEYLVDPAKDLLKKVGFTDDQANQITKEAVDSSKRELQEELQRLASSASGSGFQASQSPVQTVTNKIDELNKSATLSMIPGGLYTIAGLVSVVGLYLVLTRR